MEKEALKKAMTDSISEVLETMFFLPIDFVDNATLGDLWDPEKEELAAAKLSFSGPFSGLLYFFIPVSLARSITASFLGMDEDEVSEDHYKETVKEIINMVGGNTFSIFDDQVVFDLGIPDVAGFEEITEGKSESKNDIFIPINTLDDRLAFQINVSL